MITKSKQYLLRLLSVIFFSTRYSILILVNFEAHHIVTFSYNHMIALHNLRAQAHFSMFEHVDVGYSRGEGRTPNLELVRKAQSWWHST